MNASATMPTRYPAMYLERENIAHSSPLRASQEAGFNPTLMVKTAFAQAIKGRRQTASAVSQVVGTLSRDARLAAPVAAAAISYLSGVDLTAGRAPTQVTAQEIIRRLNSALDGPAVALTKAMLSDDEISQLRVFRQKVRDLIATN